MKLTPEQIAILAQAKVEWNKLFLQWQLDRKQYLSINEVLETIGAKWNKKEKAHIFDWEMLEEAIMDIIESWECITLKETIKKFQFYPTPPELAMYLVELADIEYGDLVLEPSAGDGSILKAIWNRNGICKVTAIEINESHRSKCEPLCDELYIQNFLTFIYPWWDKIIMNPPFFHSQDVAHILHAYSLLSEWGTLVAIASSSINTRQGSLYDDLRELNPEIIELPEGSFKESGTMVNTIIIKIRK